MNNKIRSFIETLISYNIEIVDTMLELKLFIVNIAFFYG